MNTNNRIPLNTGKFYPKACDYWCDERSFASHNVDTVGKTARAVNGMKELPRKACESMD